jgi:pilus assembly protein TadC
MLSGFVPTLVVRSGRRLRVRAIEQDLPLALELFATMAEAASGFDAALAKVVSGAGEQPSARVRVPQLSSTT